MQAGSKFKYLRCITGRHDLPFYYEEEVAVQKSFLDAFLKGEDKEGWSVEGKLPAVDMCLRVGNPGFNNAATELAAFPRRTETEWPIARTEYKKLFFDKSGYMRDMEATEAGTLRYDAQRQVYSLQIQSGGDADDFLLIAEL
jgi:predicted acyl esterase